MFGCLPSLTSWGARPVGIGRRCIYKACLGRASARACSRWRPDWAFRATTSCSTSSPVRPGTTGRWTVLAQQADRLVGGADAYLVIDDTALSKKGTLPPHEAGFVGTPAIGRRGAPVLRSTRQAGQLPSLGVTDAGAGRGPGGGRLAAVPARRMDR